MLWGHAITEQVGESGVLLSVGVEMKAYGDLEVVPFPTSILLLFLSLCGSYFCSYIQVANCAGLGRRKAGNPVITNKSCTVT